MNLLLDTHVLLWAFGEPQRLRPAVREALIDPRNTVAVSAATIWEIEIKRALGKLDAPAHLAAVCTERGFDELPITHAHAELAASLARHHDDPFDRVLAAQSVLEDLELVTADPVFDRYGIKVMGARD